VKRAKQVNGICDVATGVHSGPLDQRSQVAVTRTANLGNACKLHFGNADRLLLGIKRPADGPIRHHSSLSLPSTG
jgi:hypothetical protein